MAASFMLLLASGCGTPRPSPIGISSASESSVSVRYQTYGNNSPGDIIKAAQNACSVYNRQAIMMPGEPVCVARDSQYGMFCVEQEQTFACRAY